MKIADNLVKSWVSYYNGTSAFVNSWKVGHQKTLPADRRLESKVSQLSSTS